jgi:hypothetical protein
LVASTLDELTGPTEGLVELPHRLVWQAPRLRRFDLAEPFDLQRMYEIVLCEAIRFAELRAWLDGSTLRRVWPDLYLPRGVRQAWEDRHPLLARQRLAA